MDTKKSLADIIPIPLNNSLFLESQFFENCAFVIEGHRRRAHRHVEDGTIAQKCKVRKSGLQKRKLFSGIGITYKKTAFTGLKNQKRLSI